MSLQVAFTDEERLVGEAARNQAAQNPHNTVFDAKRLIGMRFSGVSGGGPALVLELDVAPGAWMLRHRGSWASGDALRCCTELTPKPNATLRAMPSRLRHARRLPGLACRHRHAGGLPHASAPHSLHGWAPSQAACPSANLTRAEARCMPPLHTARQALSATTCPGRRCAVQTPR